MGKNSKTTEDGKLQRPPVTPVETGTTDQKLSSKGISRREYERVLSQLHIELAKLQHWIVHKQMKVVIIFEGATQLAREERSSALQNASIPASVVSSPFLLRPSESRRSGTFNATLLICRQPARW